MSKLEAALALAARGFKVFPIKAGAKAPPILAGWPQIATSDPVTVHHMWDGVRAESNIGIHCENMIVLDVDPRKGGDDSLQLLEITYGLPETLTTLTPSGGRHLYYRGSPVPNGVDCLGPGLDVRSAGGYVVAPGSELPAGRYRFAADAVVAEAPAWLVERLGSAGPRVEREMASVADAPQETVDRAAAWLGTAERSIKGQGGDQAAYRVACHLRDLGVSEAQARELMRSDAWDNGCGWRAGWLEEKPIRSAYRYAQNEPGTLAVRAEDFPLIELGPEKPRKPSKVSRLAELASTDTPSPGYLIKGLLARRTYAQAFGAPGEGKTFIALDAAYSVAAGASWMGRKVRQGAVLYLAFEGVGGLRKRALALRQHYGTKDVPLYIASATFNVRDKEGRAELGRIIADLPEKPTLVVFDTFAHALMGGDENSAQDVGAFNNAVLALIESTGACVLIIHHSGKNKSAGARGSSALPGALDTVLEVDDGKVTATKQRDMETGEPIGFKLRPVIVGLDEDGDQVTSCVVEPDAVVSGPTGKLSGNAKRGFDVLCELRPNNSAVSEGEWRDKCAEFLSSRNLAQRFYDIKKNLRQKGYIVVDEQGLITRKMT